MEPVVELKAPNGSSFTQLELFHGICDAIGRHLLAHDCHLHDHSFFEGLSLADETPRYFVRFGS